MGFFNQQLLQNEKSKEIFVISWAFCRTEPFSPALRREAWQRGFAQNLREQEMLSLQQATPEPSCVSNRGCEAHDHRPQSKWMFHNQEEALAPVPAERILAEGPSLSSSADSPCKPKLGTLQLGLSGCRCQAERRRRAP